MTFIPQFYSKFGKPAQDLLDDKKFDLKKELSVKSKSNDGVTFTSSTKVTPIGKDGSDLKATSSLKVETDLPKIGKLEIEANTGDMLSAKLETVSLLDGLTSEISAFYDKTSGAGFYVHDCDAAVQAIYRKDLIAAKLKLNLQNPYIEHGKSSSTPSRPYEIAVSGEAAVGVTEGLSVGGDAAFATKKNKGLYSYNVGAVYNLADATATLKTANRLETVAFSYHHQVLPRVQIGGEMAFGLHSVTDKASNEKTLDISKAFAIGLLHDITDDSSVKSKIGLKQGNVILSGLFATKLNANAKISFSSTVDVLKLTGGNHTFGVKLELGSV